MRKCLNIFAFILLCTPVFAHHGSAASYEMDKEVTMAGTVTKMVWTNPHVEIFFDVKDAKGNVVNWGGETHPPIMLMKRDGWKRDTLKPGDQLTFSMHPAKAGTPVGLLTKIVFPDGKIWLRDAVGPDGQPIRLP